MGLRLQSPSINRVCVLTWIEDLFAGYSALMEYCVMKGLESD